MIDLESWHVRTVLRVLCMDPATAAEAFASDPGRQVSRKPAMVRVRRAVSHGLRVLRVGGNHLSYWDIARLTNFVPPARRDAMVEAMASRRGGAP